MKIGILCEGEFTDAPVLETLLQSQFPEVEFFIRGVSKAIIFTIADVELISMFNTKKVERAIILWDLLPIGKQLAVNSQQSDKPKRHEQRSKLLESLCNSTILPGHLKNQAQILAQRYGFPFAKANVSQLASKDDLFTLICVCYEMDGWLLSDQNLLCNLASTDAHQVNRMEPNPGEPDKCTQPTSALKRFFGTAPNRAYRSYAKYSHNHLIAKEYVKQGRVDTILRSSQSFQRVVGTVEKWIRK